MLQKIKTFIISHKIISIITVLVIIGGSYFLIKNSKSSEASYITEAVKTDNIITYVTGTGQVEATNTLTLKPGTTGDVTYVGVKAGDIVKKGKLIASVDSTDAKIALENAKISLAKLTDDPDTLTLLQKKNSVTESYNSGWNTISSFITEANSLIEEVYTIYDSGFLNYENFGQLSSLGKDKVNLANDSYYDANKSLKEINKLYRTLSRSSSQEEIKNLIDKSYESAKILANTVKLTETVFDYTVVYLDYQDNTDAISARTDIDSWLDSSNGFVTDLLSTTNSIKESEQSFDDLLAGEDELDIKSAQLTVSSKQDAYNDCFIYAPFDGVIATLTAKVGESSGSSIGTLITNEKVATVSFNEVDVASIQIGQKASLTFDAIDGLKIEGEVLEMDSLGTVSSGVVTYNVKISFAEDDERVKPGMSVNVEIITNSKKNILTISSGAIKTKSGASYVEVLGDNSMVTRKSIEVGISDDTTTEIISGLSEGDQVITKTVTGKSKTATTNVSGGNNMMMGGGAGGPMGGAAIGGIMK